MSKGSRNVCICLMALLLVAALALVAGGCGGGGAVTTSVGGTGTTGGSVTSAGGSTGTTGGSAPTGEPIVIGAIISVTGPNSALGIQESNVLQLMEKDINAAGGVLGRPLKIVIEDDKSDAQAAVTAANKLIDQDKAVALIAATGSASTLAVKPITAAKKIPQMAMVASNVVTDEAPIDWIWQTAQKNMVVAERALKYVSDTLKIKKMAILYDENAFGTDGKNSITKLAPQDGLEIVAAQSYKTADTDLTAQLTAIKGANPEALVVWGTNPGPALAAKNMKQLDMNIPYIGSHGIANGTFIKLAGDAAEGVVFPAGALVLPDSITDPARKAVTQKFIQEYTSAYNDAPNPFAGYAWSSISLLVDAITRAKSTDATAIQAALNSTQNFATPDGVYNFTATDHSGPTADDMIMVKIQGGKWVLAE